jgi:hypothetical protein
MECILYPEQYNLLFNLSFLALASSIYAVYHGNYDFATCSGGVFLTSINYWRRPTNSWRRYLDMSCVHLALAYQFYKAYRCQCMVQYYTIMFFALNCYPLGIYYYQKKLYWHSTYAHGGLHVIATIANLLLYAEKKS